MIALLAASIAACGRPDAKPEEVRPVRTQKVAAGKLDTEAGFAGEVRARYETRLAFRVGGKIVSRAVEVGSEVKAGQALATLDPGDLQLSEQSVKSQLLAAEAERDQAGADFERYADLHKRNFISAAEFQRRQTTYETARARYEQIRAQLSLTSNQSAYGVLRADHPGVITAVEAEMGQVVGMGQSVMRLARPEQKEVAISVPENRVEELKNAEQIVVTLWARPDVRFTGKLREIAPNTDPVTRTYTAKIAVPAAGDAMRLGMTATVYLRSKLEVPAVRLPLSAIHQNDAQASVWVVDEATHSVSLAPVRLGEALENQVTVVSGLKDGQRVVTAGVHLLYPGQKVKLLDN